MNYLRISAKVSLGLDIYTAFDQAHNASVILGVGIDFEFGELKCTVHPQTSKAIFIQNFWIHTLKIGQLPMNVLSGNPCFITAKSQEFIAKYIGKEDLLIGIHNLVHGNKYQITVIYCEKENIIYKVINPSNTGLANFCNLPFIFTDWEIIEYKDAL